MKKTSKAYPIQKKSNVQSISSKNRKITAIALSICAVIFIGMVIWLHSEDILQGKNDIFNITGRI